MLVLVGLPWPLFLGLFLALCVSPNASLGDETGSIIFTARNDQGNSTSYGVFDNPYSCFAGQGEEEVPFLVGAGENRGSDEIGDYHHHHLHEFFIMEGSELRPRKVLDEEHATADDVELPETAHLISQDSWLQAGFVLTNGVNSVFVLGYSGTIMVPLGWIGGVVGLLLASAISLYANMLIAKLHEFGGKRHIRYRDLAGHLYGRKAYSLTWGLQYVNLFMINTGFIILAGEALKAVYVLYRDDNVMKLPYFIAITGLVCVLFAIAIPHLSALRVWLVVSTFFSLIFIVIAIALSIKDGINSPPRDYTISGSGSSRVFTTIGAAANLVFAYNTGMLPEIQVLKYP